MSDVANTFPKVKKIDKNKETFLLI